MPRLLTGDLPGTGGLIKEAPEDFFVEELPLYLPCGEGEHLYLTVEKRRLTTFDLMQRLTGALGDSERALGYHVLKDARATTRQTVSVSGIPVEQGLALRLDGITVLSARLHRNKLRLGHLAGNRFVIRLRQVAPDARESARAVLAVLEARGVPNRFGSQRYGTLGNSDRIGRALLLRNYREAIGELIGDPEAITHDRWRQAARHFAAGDLRQALALLPGHCRNERTLLRALCDGKSAEEAAPTLGLFGPSPSHHYAPWGVRAAAVTTTIPYAQLVGAPGFDHRATDNLMGSLSVDAAAAAARELWRRCAGRAV